MKPHPSNSKLKFVTIAVITLAIALPCLLIYRYMHHMHLNHELIVAIKHQKNQRAIELLRDGADGTATEGDESVTISTVLHHFLDRFLHKNQPPSGASSSHRPALLLYYEVARDAEIDYPSDKPFPIVAENLPLLLLDKGALCNEADSERHSVVYWAAHFHSHSVLHKLVEQGANVNTSVAADGDTPLMQADIEDTRFLLTHGAHPNAANYDGQTALLNADTGKAELLLAAGAKIDVFDKYHSTPFIDACKEGRDDVALLLLRHGASLSARGRFGETALLRAAADCKLATVQALVNAGADPRARDSNGTTALMVSLNNRDTAVFDWLLGKGIDVDMRGIDGHSALSIAVQKHDELHVDPPMRARYLKAINSLRSRGAKPVKPEINWFNEEGD